MATIVDLAARGHLSITVVEKPQARWQGLGTSPPPATRRRIPRPHRATTAEPELFVMAPRKALGTAGTGQQCLQQLPVRPGQRVLRARLLPPGHRNAPGPRGVDRRRSAVAGRVRLRQRCPDGGRRRRRVERCADGTRTASSRCAAPGYTPCVDPGLQALPGDRRGRAVLLRRGGRHLLQVPAAGRSPWGLPTTG